MPPFLTAPISAIDRCAANSNYIQQKQLLRSSPVPSTPRITKPQQFRLCRPALVTRAALCVEHGGLDREQLAVVLDQARHGQRRKMPALVFRHPEVARWDL